MPLSPIFRDELSDLSYIYIYIYISITCCSPLAGAGAGRRHGTHGEVDGACQADEPHRLLHPRRLLLDRAQVERPAVDEALAQRLGDVLLHREQRAVLADGAYEQKLVEGGESFLKVRDALLLGRILVVPMLPQLVVTALGLGLGLALGLGSLLRDDLEMEKE